ncbi:hypothetical protein CPB84DRAFT_1843687 [Gymnopilus junonius]|uniref:Uncharacterized protein n=1 Tax=Gymnopilus junonius TaxID=109634 RepID=A0A9P5NXG1_GYMJU|nr:hypothetical protein CPB84DRAFT_1843687 [Gymnopilus junonius]
MNLESLKTLALRMDPHTDHYDFVELADSSKSLFDMLSLPNLETLKLSGSGVLDPSLASFIRCPSPQASLRKLCLRKLGLSAGHLSKLLQVTPNLEELITDLPEQGDLNRLAAGRSGVGTSVANTTVALLVPKLRGLVFHLRAYEVTYTLLRRHERRPILLLAPAVVEEPYFRLVLPDAEAAKDAQVDLNMDNYDENADSEGHHDSPEPAGMNTDENTALRNKLFHFRMMLRQALSELKRATTSPLRPQFASDLNTLLQEIEALKLTQGRQIANLYVRLHFFYSLNRNSTRGEKFLFRERAKRLITKWNLIITSDLKNRKIHWAIKGQRSIVYIGRDDVCHGLPQIKDTVYDGLEDNQSSLMDIMWPDPIF